MGSWNHPTQDILSPGLALASDFQKLTSDCFSKQIPRIPSEFPPTAVCSRPLCKQHPPIATMMRGPGGLEVEGVSFARTRVRNPTSIPSTNFHDLMHQPLLESSNPHGGAAHQISMKFQPRFCPKLAFSCPLAQHPLNAAGLGGTESRDEPKIDTATQIRMWA